MRAKFPSLVHLIVLYAIRHCIIEGFSTKRICITSFQLQGWVSLLVFCIPIVLAEGKGSDKVFAFFQLVMDTIKMKIDSFQSIVHLIKAIIDQTQMVTKRI